MKTKTVAALAILAMAACAGARAQSEKGPAKATAKTPATVTYMTAEEIEAASNAPGGRDHEVKVLDMGRYNVGVAVVKRGAQKAGSSMAAINHTKITEVYYITSGEGTVVTGGLVTDIKPIAKDDVLYTTVVGPGNNATFVKPAESRKVKAGDVIVIPPGVYHGFSEVPDHIEYLSVRPDPDKVLPGGYVNPAIRK